MAPASIAWLSGGESDRHRDEKVQKGASSVFVTFYCQKKKGICRYITNMTKVLTFIKLGC